MKHIRRILHVIFLSIVVSLIVFIGSMYFYPKETSSFVGFRMYTVLTNSMEPRIPTYSLIFTKVVNQKNELALEKGDIITFNANRFGEEVLITHHFNKMQENTEGVMCYRTNPEGKEELDTYETKRSDIVGTYLFHIPYLGKIVLFLQSKFGLLMYAELFVIWCVNKLIKVRWEEKEKQSFQHEERTKEKAVHLEDGVRSTSIPEEITQIIEHKNAHVNGSDVLEENVAPPPIAFFETVIVANPVTVSGNVISLGNQMYEIRVLMKNRSSFAIRNIVVDIKAMDKDKNVRRHVKVHASKEQWIASGDNHLLKYRLRCEHPLVTFQSMESQYDIIKH